MDYIRELGGMFEEEADQPGEVAIIDGAASLRDASLEDLCKYLPPSLACQFLDGEGELHAVVVSVAVE